MLVKRGDTLQLMTADGSLIALNEMVAPVETLPSFSDGLMSMGAQDGRIGFIDREGKWVIKPRFDTAGDFQNGLAIVRVDDRARTQLVNRMGNPLKEMESLHIPDLYRWPQDVWCFSAWHCIAPDFAAPCLVCGFDTCVDFPQALRINDPYQGVLGQQDRDRGDARHAHGASQRQGNRRCVHA